MSVLRTFSASQRTLTAPTAEVLLSWRTPSVVLLPFAVLPSIVYRIAQNQGVLTLMANTLAIAFCFTSLAFLKLDSFKTGSILLSGLFVYDIWWVFGTEVVSKGRCGPCTSH